MNKVSGMWANAATIQPNNFIFKSLSNWALNVAVGCNHACRFCYVPDASTNKMAGLLEPLGVTDPDAQWGDYVFPRPWDAEAFRASLRRAMKVPASDLKPDGNRAVMLCSTTDPYQVIYHENPEQRTLINAALAKTVQESLKIIRDESDLNVRILTRSPLAIRDFDLMASFGPRLMFGMSIPTLDDQIAKVYEPKAPSPSKRRETLRKAKVAGLHVYVAVAPTYPESGREDFQRIFKALTEIEPTTIFHEPINIRAENVARIEAHAASLGMAVRTEVFKSRLSWAQYAVEQLDLVAEVAKEFNLFERLHLWPDKSIPSVLPGRREWCEQWWNRISEWPKAPLSTNLHKLNEKDEVRGISDTGRDRAGKPH